MVLATLAVVALAPLMAAVTSARAGELVSLGDSYSSGEGAAPYDPDTDKKGDHKCHRSPMAWPRLVGVAQQRHLACSGALVVNIDGGGQTRSPPDNVDQLKRLRALASVTTIDRVMMTIGGNDRPLYFAKRLPRCRFASCLRDADKIISQLSGLQARLETTYRQVRQASGAPLLVVGYPDLFPRPGSSVRCGPLDNNGLIRFDKVASRLETVMSSAARAAGADYLSMRSVLRGHELCTARSYIRSLGGKPGDVTVKPDLSVDQQQGHPLLEGQLLMAERVLKWLSGRRPACAPASNVAAIVDDSGSMADNDPENIRRRALELLLTKPTNQARTFGAVEFAGDAGPLFGPAAVGPNRPAMLASLGALRNDGFADDNGTDYNEAFAASTALQPSPGARIFLTDGGHNVGDYGDGHIGGPPTYVIGLNIGPADSGDEAAALLARIASDTGGRYFPLRLSEGDSPEVQVSRLQPALNEIETSIGCATVQTEDTIAMVAPNRPSRSVNALFANQPGMEIVISWPNPSVDVDVGALSVRDGSGRVVADLQGAKRIARTKRRRSKIAVSTVEGQTFDTITLKRPPSGRILAVQLNAPKLPEPTPVTVQIRPIAIAPGQTTTTVVPTGPQTAPGMVGPTNPTGPQTTPPPPAVPPPARVNAYENYGPGAVGHAMCRGNPTNPASMPGGTASQTFIVPSGVASIDTALAQIDPDNQVTGHARLLVNGTQRATADAVAAGDTTFSFPSVAVTPGDSVALSINFTGSFGKIITVYTVGGGRGTFTTSNSCPAGADNTTTTSTALRAVISGWNR